MDGNKNDETIGQRIGKLRTERNESQEALAKAIDEARETIKHWENGTRRIKAESIVKLSEHFGVTSDYLLGLSNTKSPDVSVQAACELTGLSEGAILATAKHKDDSPCSPLHALDFLLTQQEFFTVLCSVQLAMISCTKDDEYYNSEEISRMIDGLENFGFVVLTGKNGADYFIQRASDLLRVLLIANKGIMGKFDEGQQLSIKPSTDE